MLYSATLSDVVGKVFVIKQHLFRERLTVVTLVMRKTHSIKQQRQRRKQEKPSKQSLKPSERGKQAKYYNM